MIRIGPVFRRYFTWYVSNNIHYISKFVYVTVKLTILCIYIYHTQIPASIITTNVTFCRSTSATDSTRTFFDALGSCTAIRIHIQRRRMELYVSTTMYITSSVPRGIIARHVTRTRTDITIRERGQSVGSARVGSTTRDIRARILYVVAFSHSDDNRLRAEKNCGPENRNVIRVRTVTGRVRTMFRVV